MLHKRMEQWDDWSMMIRQPNRKVKKLMVQGKPHLCLFALNDIFPGEEITYDAIPPGHGTQW